MADGGVQFDVPVRPVSVNGRYHGTRSGGFYSDSKAKDFKAAIAAVARAAKPSWWPALDLIPRRSLIIEIKAYGSRADVDAPGKFAMDALEGIYYTKDSAIKRLVLSVEAGSEPFLRITIFSP